MKPLLIFPHQLFAEIPVENDTIIYLIEEFLFFKQYKFHQQKIVHHRSTMKRYADYLKENNFRVVYINSFEEISDIRILIPELQKKGITELMYIDTTDNWLEKRIIQSAEKYKIRLTQLPSPLFINTKKEIEEYFKTKRFFQTDFYIHQRKERNILVDQKQQPAGGKWTYDTENRLKYPKDKTPPEIIHPKSDAYFEEAKSYCNKYFSGHYGSVENDQPLYPDNFDDAKKWLKQFLKNRFSEFGPYEDAIVTKEHFLHHSVLTPVMNIGLLTPDDVVKEVLKFASKENIPLASTEGFIRQIIGWREFMRSMYELRGVEARTKNYWKFSRKIPEAFWKGTTGIDPVDAIIKKVLATGYCHHIERLMVLGNFMLLCEFDPDDVYRWFMELFIDAYDWVMVPNVYSMSQFADGGIMATKPYISSSNYLKKMSDFKNGEWQEIWDGLFWRFMSVHRNFFEQNPRLGMLLKTFEKMPAEKRNHHLKKAENFLLKIDNGEMKDPLLLF